MLILTHGHYDHVGYASILQKEYGASIAIHKGDLEKVTNGSMDFPQAKGIFSNFIRNSSLRGIKNSQYTPFVPDVIIENEKIKGFPNLQIVPLPGHTPGSIGILYENNLFAGDLVMNMPIPSKSWFAEDFDVLYQSINKVKQLSIQRIYPGHGNGFSFKLLKYI